MLRHSDNRLRITMPQQIRLLLLGPRLSLMQPRIQFNPQETSPDCSPGATERPARSRGLRRRLLRRLKKRQRTRPTTRSRPESATRGSCFCATSRDFTKAKIRNWVTDVWGNATAGSNAEAVLLLNGGGDERSTRIRRSVAHHGDCHRHRA